MAIDSMTSAERLQAAVNLEPSDRVPVYPHLNFDFPLKLAGRPMSDSTNILKAAENEDLLVKLQEDTGYDGLTQAPVLASSAGMLNHFALYYGDTMSLPGQDERLSDGDSPPQFGEHELIKTSDYDAIIALGWNNWCDENMHRLSKTLVGLPLAEFPLPTIAELLTGAYVKFRDRLTGLGVPIIAGSLCMDPQMILSLGRTLTGFSMDLRRCPDKVTGVLKAISKDLTQDGIDSMRRAPSPPSGLPGIMMACERGSGAYYNLKTFEQFVWPYMQETINAWVDEGYVVTLHLDTNWTKNFPYFLDLPKKKCIAMLDSTSDIFKAKEILGDHMCIMGDVPASLSTLGTVEEMDAYCKRLIEVVGKGGGFILGTGCAVPPDTKLENFKAMINSAKKYSAN